MKKILLKIAVLTLVVLLSLNSFWLFADAALNLSEIVYDDAAAFYLSSYNEVDGTVDLLRLSKDFSSIRRLTKAEQRRLLGDIRLLQGLPFETIVTEDSVHLTEDNHFIDSARLMRELAINNGWLYDTARASKLLDIRQYAQALADYYAANDMTAEKSLDPVVRRYQLTKGTFYHSLNYIDEEGSAAFGYSVFPKNDYLLVLDGDLKIVELAKDFMLNKLIRDGADGYWLVGNRLVSRFRSIATVYHLTADGDVKLINDLFLDLVDPAIDAEQVDLNVNYLTVRDANLVAAVQPRYSWFDPMVGDPPAKFYDITTNFKFSERPEKLALTEIKGDTWPTKWYAGDKDHIYYLDVENNRLHNLTTRQSHDIAIEIAKPQHKVGDIVGDVLHTDIVTYFNGQPINSVNVAGKTAIEVRNLGACGFAIAFDDVAKRVILLSGQPSDQQALYRPAVHNLKVGTPVGHLLFTDIVVYLDDKQIPAYNYDGHMVIMVRDLAAHGFVVDYDDALRRVEIEEKYDATTEQ